MFEKLKKIALEKGYKLARLKGAKCPECSKPLDLPREMPVGGLDAIFYCDYCGWSGSVTDFMSRGSKYDVVKQKPAQSKIQETFTAEGLTWVIPAKRRPNFFLFFALIWLSFTSFMTFMFVLGDPVDSETGEPVSRWIGLFFVPFWAVGIGIFYAGINMALGSQSITVGRGKIILKKHLLGTTREKSLELNDIESVYQDVAYEQNDSPVYRIRVKAKEGKDLKFGTNLKREERSWLEYVISEACGLRGDSHSRIPGGNEEVVSTRHSREIEDYELEEIDEKGLVLERMMGSGFRVKKKYRLGIWLLLGSVVLLGAAGFLFYECATGMMTGREEFHWTDIIGAVFSLIPGFIGAGFTVVSIVLFFVGMFYLGLEETYEFGDHELVFKKGKRGQVKKSTRYNRSEFDAVTKKQSGHVNNEPRYGVELLIRGKKKVKLCSFVKIETANTLEKWLTHWIQNNELSGYGAAREV